VKRVVVAMSGGVDSSVAAFLLKKQGFDVIGLTMRLSSAPSGDAGRAARRLGIPHRVVDYRRESERDVIKYFCSEYLKGRTANPCVVCNRKIKFGKLLEKAKALGADFLATGHYARLGRDSASGRYFIREAADRSKDQSYFLFDLGQRQLRSLLFPLGDIEKAEVKKIAKAAGLKTVHDKPESQDICFIRGKGYREFIRGRARGIRPGKVVDTGGKYLGMHKGIAFYTIGQREGLGIAAGRPIYVVKLDPRRNEVIVGDAGEVKGRELTADNVRWMSKAGLSKPVRAQAKIRYNHPKSACRVMPLSASRVKAVFDEPQHAITPGQALVVYDGEKVLGGGWIE